MPRTYKVNPYVDMELLSSKVDFYRQNSQSNSLNGSTARLGPVNEHPSFPTAWTGKKFGSCSQASHISYL